MSLILLSFYLLCFNSILCEVLFYDSMATVDGWIQHNAGIADSLFANLWCSSVDTSCAWIGSNIDLLGGISWIETTVSTIGYHSIQLQHSMYPVLDSDEYCRVLYSTNRVNYTILQIYDMSMNGAWAQMRTLTDQLGADADNIDDLSIKFDLIALGGGDYCAINEIYLYGEAIPTLQPTKPTNYPSKSPTHYPTIQESDDDGESDIDLQSPRFNISATTVILIVSFVGAFIIALIVLMRLTKHSEQKLAINAIHDAVARNDQRKEVSVLPMTVEGDGHIAEGPPSAQFVVACDDV